MQPPWQDPTNQGNTPRQPDQTTRPQPLPENTLLQNQRQGDHPKEELYYGTAPQSPYGNYTTPDSPNSYDNNAKLGQPKRRSKAMTIIMLVLLALVIILGATTVLLWRYKSIPPDLTAPTATPQTGTPAPTTITSATATVQPTATVVSGTITENLQLTCGANCNDPIHVTIKTIQVDDADGNMIWNVSLQNITGSSINYGMGTFDLLPSGAHTPIPATLSQSNGTLTNSDPYSLQGVFAFVPIQNTTYTLTVMVEANPYGGPTINFDPAQISL